MKPLISSVLSVWVLALVVAIGSGTASAQIIASVDGPLLQTNYFSNNVAAAPDAEVRILNDGTQGGTRGSFTKPGTGSLCAMIYVHSADQQLVECCGCLVTPNGLQTIDVKTQLTANTLTGKVPADGVIEILSAMQNSNASPTSSAGNSEVTGAAAVDNSQFCDPTDILGGVAKDVYLEPGLLSWATHIQNPETGFVSGSAIKTGALVVPVGTYPETETTFDGSSLSFGEIENEENLCNFDVINGSGAGICDCGKFEN